jgi:hypothetical protein
MSATKQRPTEEEILTAIRRIISGENAAMAPVNLLIASDLTVSPELVDGVVSDAPWLAEWIAMAHAQQKISLCERIMEGKLKVKEAEFLMQVVLGEYVDHNSDENENQFTRALREFYDGENGDQI